jgi:hypothetical protein
MPRYEYRVLPAPKRGIKVAGAKTTEDRFAQALQAAMNELGAQGWDFVRSDTLPCEERQGLTGKTTVYQTMLVFRRVIEEAADATPRIMIPAPAIVAPLTTTDSGEHQAPPLGPAEGRIAAQ